MRMFELYPSVIQMGAYRHYRERAELCANQHAAVNREILRMFNTNIVYDSQNYTLQRPEASGGI